MEPLSVSLLSKVIKADEFCTKKECFNTDDGVFVFYTPSYLSKKKSKTELTQVSKGSFLFKWNDSEMKYECDTAEEALKKHLIHAKSVYDEDQDSECSKYDRW
eukprot:gene1541-12667_t